MAKKKESKTDIVVERPTQEEVAEAERQVAALRRFECPACAGPLNRLPDDSLTCPGATCAMRGRSFQRPA